MNKNDTQSVMLMIAVLGVGLLTALALESKSAIVIIVLLFVFFVTHQFRRFEYRIRQLEQQCGVTTAMASMQALKWGMYLGVLIGGIGYWLHDKVIVFVGIGFAVVSLIWILNVINTRLQRIENKGQISSSKSNSAPIISIVSHHVENYTPDQIQSPQQGHIASGGVTQQSDLNNSNLPLKPSLTEQRCWQSAFDWLLHGNPILRVAIAILMIGVVLLLRFASEHWQLSLSVKLFGIALAGSVLTTFGYLLRQKNTRFAVALQGAGLAVVFLTMIFAHHYRVMTSPSTANIGFVILLIITVILSLRQNAVYLSMLALSMAYLAPLLIPKNHPDSIFLISYYLLINLAVAAMNFIKPWKILNHIAFFATGLITGTVIVLYANQAQYQILDMILWLHVLLFIWLSARYSQLIQKEFYSLKNQHEMQLPPLVDVGLIFSVPIFGFTLHAFLMQQSSLALSCGALALGLTYTAMGWWIKQKQSELSILAKSFFILAMSFIALIFPLYQGAHWTATAWVVQGTALIVWGVSERYRLSRYLGVVLVMLSSIALFYQIWSDDHFPVLSISIYAIAQFITAYFLFRHESSQGEASIFSSLFLSLALYSGAVTGVRFFAWQGQGLSPYLAIASLLCFAFAVMVYLRAHFHWLISQLAIISMLILLCFAELIQQGGLANFYWSSSLQRFSFLIAVIPLSVLLMWMVIQVRLAPKIEIWWAGVLWLSLAAMGPALWPSATLLSLGMIPVLFSIGWFKQQQRFILDQTSVWVLTWLWLLWVSLSDQVVVSYYLPILNPVDCMSLLLLSGLLWVIYHHGFSRHSKLIEWSYKVLSIFMALLVLSSIVIRALHVYLATPLWGWAIWLNGSVQLSLTLLWVILAFVLMTFASQRHIRQLWFVGAVLLVMVVVKLVGLDLSQSGTLTRVISFIGAGGVMLVIAYLAPLPPVQLINKNADN